MEWLTTLNSIANNPAMTYIPVTVFFSITAVSVIYGLFMGWIGAIAMLVWNYLWFFFVIIFVEQFVDLFGAFEVSAYIPDYILEPVVIGLWMLIANAIGYFIMFLFKKKITSRMVKYKNANVSVWQDRIMGAGIMVTATLPVSLFGSAVLSVAGDSSRVTSDIYSLGLKGMSLGKYDILSKDKDMFNNYFELISDEEATELFIKLLMLDETWLTNRTVEEVSHLNSFTEQITGIINHPKFAEHFTENIFDIAEKREIEIKRVNLINEDYPGTDENGNAVSPFTIVPEGVFGIDGDLKINQFEITNIGTSNLVDFVNTSVVDHKLLDETRIEEYPASTYIDTYFRSYLTAFAYVEPDEE